MTIFLLIFAAILLLFLGVALLKQNIFLSLIEETEANQKFLKTYGIIYILLAIISAILVFFSQTLLTLIFIAIMMFVSALFSIQFSRKMSK